MSIVPDTGAKPSAFKVGDMVCHTSPSGQQIVGRVYALDILVPSARMLVDTTGGTRACLYPGFCVKVPDCWAQ